MNRIRQKMQQFMYGRNGADDLSRVSLWIALILMIIAIFSNNIVYLIGMIFLFYSIFRMYSRNIGARRAENDKFLYFCSQTGSSFRRFCARMADRRTHRIFRCPNCRQKIRVPKGKGNIMIRCPKCGIEFRKHT